jgi:hypothetical protein
LVLLLIITNHYTQKPRLGGTYITFRNNRGILLRRGQGEKGRLRVAVGLYS